MSVISAQNLTKKYPKFKLSEVSFSLEEGRILGLIGRNGAGKTTMLKSILNLVHPSSGIVRVFGMDFSENEVDIKQGIGVVFGGIDYYHNKRLGEIGKVTQRFYRDWDSAAYEAYCIRFGLDIQKRVNELSEGMKVKYLIALALSHNAHLLILDEPTSGIDPVSRDELLGIFGTLVRDKNMSILFSTHVTSDLDKCADDIAYIKDGTLLACTDKDSFIHSYQYLKKETDHHDLTLEEIMIRLERCDHDAESTL